MMGWSEGTHVVGSCLWWEPFSCTYRDDYRQRNRIWSSLSLPHIRLDISTVSHCRFVRRFFFDSLSSFQRAPSSWFLPRSFHKIFVESTWPSAVLLDIQYTHTQRHERLSVIVSSDTVPTTGTTGGGCLLCFFKC